MVGAGNGSINAEKNNRSATLGCSLLRCNLRKVGGIAGSLEASQLDMQRDDGLAGLGASAPDIHPPDLK